MSIDRLQSNARMSQAVVHNGTVYLAGQVAIEQAGASVSAQTQAILAKIDALLAEAGSSKTSLLSATIWLTDMTTFGEMNAVWDAWLPAGGAPARATVGAPLAIAGLDVEIAVIAAIEG